MTAALKRIDERLDRLEKITLIGAKTVLDLTEASLLTGFSIGHLYRLTSSRQIPHFKRGRKLYFKKSELEEWMLEQKILTEDGIDTQADTYAAIHKH